MNDKRQKNQLQRVLAFTEEGRSEAPKAPREGTESLTAKCETESPAREEQRMEEVCGRENCQQALRRVKANKGSPGIDGMRVEKLPGYLKQHWPALREQLLSGTYQPQPVRRVEVTQAKATSNNHRETKVYCACSRLYSPLRSLTGF
jgi:RNA-directed DNA polymerase